MHPFVKEFFVNPVSASWAQAAIYLATLAVLIRSVRLQTRATQQAQYAKCQSDFTETYRLLVQSGIHAKVYDHLSREGQSAFSRWSHYNSDDKTAYAYLELLYEIFERVYVLFEHKWIPASEWEQWKAWVDDVAKDPLLPDVYHDNKGMFNPHFESFVSEKLKAVSQARTPPGQSSGAH